MIFQQRKHFLKEKTDKQLRLSGNRDLTRRKWVYSDGKLFTGNNKKYYENHRSVEWARIYVGAYHLAKKFRFEVKWKGNFPEIFFGNCGQPPEVVLFFRSERNSQNALTICKNPSVSRPFLTRSSKICGMECCVVNGKRHSHPVGH